MARHKVLLARSDVLNLINGEIQSYGIRSKLECVPGTTMWEECKSAMKALRKLREQIGNLDRYNSAGGTRA